MSHQEHRECLNGDDSAADGEIEREPIGFGRFRELAGQHFVFVKRIGDSVASKNLFPTTNKVMERNQTSAAELVNIAVRLNFPNELAANKNKIAELDKEFTKNYLSKKLLKFLVIDHLYKFDVKYSDKQSICAKLDINIMQNKQIYHEKNQ